MDQLVKEMVGKKLKVATKYISTVAALIEISSLSDARLELSQTIKYLMLADDIIQDADRQTDLPLDISKKKG